MCSVFKVQARWTYSSVIWVVGFIGVLFLVSGCFVVVGLLFWGVLFSFIVVCLFCLFIFVVVVLVGFFTFLFVCFFVFRFSFLPFVVVVFGGFGGFLFSGCLFFLSVFLGSDFFKILL